MYQALFLVNPILFMPPCWDTHWSILGGYVLLFPAALCTDVLYHFFPVAQPGHMWSLEVEPFLFLQGFTEPGVLPFFFVLFRPVCIVMEVLSKHVVQPVKLRIL